MELGVVAYRTPIVRHRGEESSDGGSTYLPDALLPDALDFLADLLEEELSNLLLRELLIGNAVSAQANRSYSTRKVLSQHKIKNFLSKASISYLDTACLTSFCAANLMKNVDEKSVNAYIGFEDLNYSDLIGLSRETPESEFSSPREISKSIADYRNISIQGIEGYIEKSRSHWDSFQSSKSYKRYLFNCDCEEGIGYDLPVEKIPVMNGGEIPLHFGRLAKGATIIITTKNIGLVQELGGLIVKGIGVSSNIGDPTTISPLVSSAKNALKSAERELDEIDTFEIFDSYLPVAIALSKELGLPIDRVNMCGNALVRGDTISAAGGLLLCNVETLFRTRNDFQSGLVVLYSMPQAISLVVESSLKNQK